MVRVRKTSSDSPRDRSETTAQIPMSILLGSFDAVVTTQSKEAREDQGSAPDRSLNDAEHRLLVAIRSDAWRLEVGTEFDPRRLLRGDMTERQRAPRRRRRRKCLEKLFADDPRVDAGA